MKIKKEIIKKVKFLLYEKEFVPMQHMNYVEAIIATYEEVRKESGTTEELEKDFKEKQESLVDSVMDELNT